MAIAPNGPTKAAAGVIPTNPAMAPDARPNAVTCPAEIFSTSIQPKIPPNVASMVVIKISEDEPSIAKAEPTLNPNQPAQRKAAPTRTNTTLCGGIGVVGQPLRLPSTKAPTKEVTPALICTAVPPAKSNTPQL